MSANTNIMLLAVSTAIITCYNFFIFMRYGVRESISASYYSLPKNVNFVFTLVLWAFVFPLMIAGSNPLMFFAGAGIAFVGAAPDYKSILAGKVHSTAAVLGILFGMLSIAITFKLIVPVAIFFVGAALIALKNPYGKVYWIENLAILTILGSLFYVNIA
jgi:hypothetical protein